jgi:RNA polymerase sigma-70 factor (ECF subfamily)
VNERKLLAGRFEADRAHLKSVAYRMLGSQSEADDAVQEAWLRLSRSDTAEVRNLTGWLTTVVARVCLDILRARKSRREEPLETGSNARPLADESEESNPEHDTLMADSISLALLVVLETLSPAERVAFVLHDMFDVPFEEIAPIVGRTPPAARQLASRARRRVQGAEPPPAADRGRQHEIVEAFLAASRGGDFGALLTLLDPEVVLRADPVAVAGSRAAEAYGAPAIAPELRGAERVAQAFAGRAKGAQPALIDGAAGLVWAPGGTPRVAFRFMVIDAKIVGIELVAEPDRLGRLEISLSH